MAADSTGAPLSTVRVPQLDGIRGLAILLVLLWHYVGVKLTPDGSAALDASARALALTWTGVDLFFVLSGFLIGGILLDHRQAPHYFKAFYARRVSRIFPLYFAWLSLFALVAFSVSTWSPAEPLRGLFGDALPFWSYASFTQNILMVTHNTYGPEWLGITWSLAIEEQFYALIPLVVRFIPIRRLPFLLFLYIALAPLMRVTLVFVPGYNALVNHVLMPPRADALLLGVLCAWLVRDPRASQFLGRHLRALYGAFCLLLFGVGILSYDFNTPRSFLMASFGYSWLALFYTCLLLLAALDERGPLARLTLSRALRNLGLLAYGVYLIHQAVNILVHRLLLGRWPQLQTLPDIAVTLLALVATLMLAWLSYRYFESPILAWGHRVRYGQAPSPAASAPAEQSAPLPAPTN